jgi:muconate cycloisomerase
MNRIDRIRITEVVVPARQGTINSAEIDQPLHKLPVAGSPAWSKQFDELPKAILELFLEDGTVGLGEFYRDHDWRILDSVAEQLLGQDIEELPRSRLPIAHCREYDGFECAIWVAYAKMHGLRLVDLLGGPVREKIWVGAWSGHRTVGDVGPLVSKYGEAGFDCIKFKCSLQDDVVGWCQQIAKHAPGMQVILDPNERWERVAEARRLVEQLSTVGNVLCIEDPLPRWMLKEYSQLRNYSSISVVLHVSLPYIYHGQRVHDAIVALQSSAVDGFNFNGGLARFQQLDHIAGAANLPCWHGSEIDLGILEAMYLHQCAAAESCLWPSDIFGRLIREHDLLTKPIDIRPPLACLPSGAGLGVEIERDAVNHYQTKVREYRDPK